MLQGENVRDLAGLIISSGSTTHWSDRPQRGNLLSPAQEASCPQPITSPDGAGSSRK